MLHKSKLVTELKERYERNEKAAEELKAKIEELQTTLANITSMLNNLAAKVNADA